MDAVLEIAKCFQRVCLPQSIFDLIAMIQHDIKKPLVILMPVEHVQNHREMRGKALQGGALVFWVYGFQPDGIHRRPDICLCQSQ